MILSEKITNLRKRMNWSQEELAEKLSVSRQSVSKWEVGATIPDLDKILKMSELFGVSTDFLLKDEKETGEYLGETETPEERTVGAEEANEYMDIIRGISSKIAFAVLMFILSPVCLIEFAGLAEAGYMAENLSGALGLGILLILVAAGVGICIYNSMKTKKYDFLTSESFSLSYGVSGIVEKRKQEFSGIFRRNLVVGVVLCIIGVIPLVTVGAFFQKDLIAVTCVCVMLIVISIGVRLIVSAAIIEGSFDRLLQQGDYTRENKEAEKKLSPLSGCYWLIVTAIYLAVSFCLDRWDKTWIIWPVAGVLFGAICAVIKAAMGINKSE